MDKVFVSGGSGYIALHCIAKLIKKGYVVKTSIRSIDRKQEIIDSISKVVDCKQKLEFCQLDLLKDDGWDDALKGCKYVLHTASPVSLLLSNNPDDLIKPAVNGLERCLNSAVKNNVKRFVMTSSFSAIGAGSKEKELDDTNWTDLNNPHISPYDISKTMAEKFLWEYASKLDKSKNIEVCSINPVIVVGPSLSEDVGVSNTVVKKLLDGTSPMVPRFGLHLVDVKDVADMHLEAMINPKAAGKRFLLCSESLWFKEVSNILRSNNFNKAPKFTAPNLLVKILAMFDKELKIVLFYLGFKNKLNSNNAKKILRWKPEKVNQAIIDTAKQLYELGILK
ncbi:MAG: aldehyde reductase [Candidatus Marinimicrobia bacterium]|nr:aldehyde reductase [Candidatus Neomarinimicrobiota bacterium]